jgi:hypothetical protein
MSQLRALPLGAAARVEATARRVDAAALAAQPAPGADAALHDLSRGVALGLVEAAIAVPIRACSQLLHAFAERATARPERSARSTLAALPIGAGGVRTSALGAALVLQTLEPLAQLLDLALQLREVARGARCAFDRALGLRALGSRAAVRSRGPLGGTLCAGRANEEGGDDEGGPAVHGGVSSSMWRSFRGTDRVPWRDGLNPAVHCGFRTNDVPHTDFTGELGARSVARHTPPRVPRAGHARGRSCASDAVRHTEARCQAPYLGVGAQRR